MQCRLLAIDLDGTFLDNNCLIPDNNMEAILQLKQKNIQIVLCSGRSYLSINLFAPQLSLNQEDNYGIAFNGAMIYKADTFHIVNQFQIKQSLANEITIYQ